MRGQTITTVVERALEAAGEQAKISQEFGEDLTWKDFWDVSEGVRALRLYAEPEVFPTYEEEKRLDFARRFREYFYKDSNAREPHRDYCDILWPKIDDYIDQFEKMKGSDFWAAEKSMRVALLTANIRPPDSRSGITDKAALDDDIPF